MDEKEFALKADACLERAARWLENFDPDELDYSTAGGMVTLEFADGARFILNRQSAARQVWLAAGPHGYHFGYDASKDAWLDDKDGRELFGRLVELVSEKVGRPAEPAP